MEKIIMKNTKEFDWSEKNAFASVLEKIESKEEVDQEKVELVEESSKQILDEDAVYEDYKEIWGDREVTPPDNYQNESNYLTY